VLFGQSRVKFLADEQIPKTFSAKLRQLDFDVEEVQNIPTLRGQDDVNVVLLYAKRRQRILLSTDNMADRQTRVRLFENLRRTKRGKVLTVSGGPEQGWPRFVGKVIYHMETWEAFFADGHGRFIIGDLKPDTARGQRPWEMPRRTKATIRQGGAYVAAKEAAQSGPVNPKLGRRKPKSPPAGARLMG
jgi:hypothetical protein